ncbi:putative Zinc finger, CCCH-type, Smr domain, Smr domain superfamily, protein suppressor of sable [Septoria linicola]|nr:putative Zinc finger, CCCH-type, Smr domain, Smr domain superfamily, protein suppressor of sable [Septoria linicola]
MVSERIYDLCRPVLDDDGIADEEKVEKLEELLAGPPASLKGKALEDAVLGTLWQWKSSTESTSSPPAVRRTNVVRSKSPAPWIQRAATPASGKSSPRPTTATPTVPPGFGPPALARTKSQTVGSPFSSPKPSPRLPLATPVIPHSPRLSAYQFSDNSSPNTENYGDYGSDNVDWLVNDDASSQTSFGDSGFNSASEFMSSYDTQMSPYDMLRSILQDNKTDDELEQILMANGYDLSETVNSLMEAQGMGPNVMAAAMQEQQNRTFLVGKDMRASPRPETPPGQQKSSTVCRYWLASGHCARADCRFAHEVQNHLCKYWMAGNCIAGASCLFSHDPALLMQQFNIGSGPSTPSNLAPNFQLQDFDSFPALQPTTSNPYEENQSIDANTLNAALLQQQQILAQQAPGLFPNFVPTGPRIGSRPGSRHSHRSHGNRDRNNQANQPNFQDDEAFPTLGSAANKPAGKRHHGKRGGHGHHNQGQPVQQPGSLADVVRMSPSPSPLNARDAMRRGLKNNRSFTATRENSAAAMAISAPKEVPWLETGEKVNQAYMKARQEAFKHGGLRNKFLQSAAQAWNRNDARGAKALSLRGQNENQLMREKHREAARALYEERNKSLAAGKELYVDLHGLHPEEAVQYLSDCLKEQMKSTRPVYAICGTGHHSKNGKDKVGKAIRAFLNDWRYAFREFSVPGDRNNIGGILGIDPTSFDKDAPKRSPLSLGDGDSGVGLDEGKRESTKVQVVTEDPRKLTASSLRRVEISDEDGS